MLKPLTNNQFVVLSVINCLILIIILDIQALA